MHKVKVFFFATLRDYVGAKSLEIEIPLEMTIRGLIDLLAVTYPRLSNVKGSILAAINREYTAEEQIIPVNAEIALFPPVSGG
jgi:molybdopterin converting factor subunit 1